MGGLETSSPSSSLLFFFLGIVTVLGFVAARWRQGDLDQLHEWGLGGRRFGTIVTWFLLGGDLYTAYTFIAVPALVFGAGAFGFFAVPYTVIAYLAGVPSSCRGSWSRDRTAPRVHLRAPTSSGAATGRAAPSAVAVAGHRHPRDDAVHRAAARRHPGRARRHGRRGARGGVERPAARHRLRHPRGLHVPRAACALWRSSRWSLGGGGAARSSRPSSSSLRTSGATRRSSPRCSRRS